MATLDAKNQYAIVLTTTGSEQTATELANKILAEKLAACIQVQHISSHYIWQGRICHEPEFLLLIKTRADFYTQLEKFIRKNHIYEVPEIIQIPITRGFEDYLSWIDTVISG